MLSRRAAALSLGTLLVAGCSGGSDPAPSTLPTLTSTPSPTVTLAPVPPAATALTPQGADAFVRYFFDQMNVAFRTSNASLIDALSTPACITCNNYEKALTEASKAGHFLNGDSFKISAVAAAPPEVDHSAVDVIGSLPARDVVDAQGKVSEHIAATSRFYFIVTVKRRANMWTVSDIALGKS